ncbi:MAG: heavy metal translocating P-type ATPase [Bacteroidota bacterium]|nr:heavy metal translocating P-type ATPase [Bacteroidota bacterium]
MNSELAEHPLHTPVERIFEAVQHLKLEIAFTVLCLVFILSSITVEHFHYGSTVIFVINILSYGVGGWFGVQKAYESLSEGKFNVDLLMIISAIGAATINQWHEGATLLFLFSLSNVLQEYALDRSRNAIKALLKLRPNVATVVRNGKEIPVDINDLKINDHVVIRPGENIPVDGTIVIGQSDVNQASITGESVPVEKNIGDGVFAGTMNGSGALEVMVTKLATDSTLSRIIQLVESAQHQRARTQRFLDTFESYYAIGVIVFTISLIFVPWIILGSEFVSTFYKAMVVLVVASPCALVISTPASILSAIANGARRGILYKGGAYMEKMSEVRVVAFDKTGTLTQGKMHVTNVYVSKQNSPQSYTENNLIALAASLESRSEHPIAKAVMDEALQHRLPLPSMTNFAALPGRGVHAISEGFLTWIGGYRMFEEHGEVIPNDILAQKEKYESEGKSVLIVHRELGRSGDTGIHEEEGGWLGCIAVADIVRPDAKQTIAELKRVGIIRTVMLTGDNAKVAQTIATQAGVDEFYADLLPEQKVSVLRMLEQKYGPVAMVGDGVNDAPALATASVGIAMGAAGTDVAMETADVVLMADKLSNIPYAVGLSRRARRVVWQNIIFSMSVIAVLVISALGLSLPLPLGVVGHEGSTLIVVANGLRLLRK